MSQTQSLETLEPPDQSTSYSDEQERHLSIEEVRYFPLVAPVLSNNVISSNIINGLGKWLNVS